MAKVDKNINPKKGDWDDDRYFTVAESSAIVGIHTRIKKNG